MAFQLKCEESLDRNDPKALHEAVSVLYKIVNSIYCFPTDPVHRQLSLDRDEVINFLLPVDGAMECLFEIGFEEGSDSGSLQLPPTASMETIIKIRNVLRRKRHRMEEIDFNSLPRSNNQFIQLLITRHRQFAWLREDGIANLSYKVIPHQFLERHIEREKNKSEKINQPFNEELAKLQFLVFWFKEEFFEWVDKPLCPRCQTPTAPRAITPSSPSQNIRIENYQCEKCGRHVEFPRHTDPEILLETRKGRCGEWAISFTHICRALNLDARIVYDETDHVWTEVFLQLDQKWVHCDPCEGVIDAPLIYEAGWKKNLSYVVAYSQDEIQDVTWRYSSQHCQVLQRRKLVGEAELAKFLADYRVACFAKKSETRRRFLIERCAKELASMMVEIDPGNEDLCGRKSGSLDWRLSRGEATVQKHVWRISEGDLQGSEWCFGYSVARNCYFVGNKPVGKTWDCGLYDSQNVFRKVEKDWNMAYLARNEGTDSGEVLWRFQLDDGYVVDKIAITFQVAVFETGVVKASIHCDDRCDEVNTQKTYETCAMNGRQVFSVSAKLTGGVGSTAWQHAQLFRQKLNANDIPFKMVVRVKKAG